MWETIFVVAGGVASLIAIGMYAYSSLRSHISSEIDRRLGETKIEEKVATRLSEKMLETADVIQETNRTIGSLQSSMSTLARQEADARMLAESLEQRLRTASRKNREIETLQASTEKQALNLTERIGDVDPIKIERAREFLDMLNSASLPTEQLLDVQSRIDQLAAISVRAEPFVWIDDFKYNINHEASHGGTFSEQSPQLTVDPFGNVHLRGNVMELYGGALAEEEIRQSHSVIDKSFFENDYGSILDVAMYLPVAYAPPYEARFVVTGRSGKIYELIVNSRSWVTDENGENYFVLMARDWFEMSLDGVCWSPQNPIEARKRFNLQVAKRGGG